MKTRNHRLFHSTTTNLARLSIGIIVLGLMLFPARTTFGQEAADSLGRQINNLIKAWGPCKGECPFDLNGDLVIDSEDLVILLGNGNVTLNFTPTPPSVDPRIDPPSKTEPFRWNTGVHDGLKAQEPVSVARTTITHGGAAWLRFKIADYDLGRNSYITLTSSLDKGMQRHTSRTLPQWYDFSAFFNGDSVTIELFVAPDDTGVYVSFESVIVGRFLNKIGDKTICGTTDDRVASSDFRVGRAVLTNGNRFCSFWLASNGSVISAGHCVDFGSSGDGIFDLVAGTLIEFNFPASLANTTPVAANPNDQYPVNINNPQFDNTTSGQDWAVIAINPNANTGQRAHVAYGFFRTTREIPAVSTTLRITGCGTDTGTQNRTLQTHTGPYQGEGNSGARWWHTYRVDTTGGNSGSPVIWNAFGVAIGIHTNAGCTATGGANLGCSFEHNPLEIAVDDFPGSGTLYVDAGMPALGPAESGNIFRPYNTVTEGVNALTAGNVLSIVEGSYSDIIIITKAMTIEAPVGTVTIGN